MENKRKAKLHIRKGDTVLVIAGDDKGKKGKVLEILLEKNRLRALAHNPEQEEAEEEVEIEYDGQEMEIGFNVSYLLDALAIIKTPKVRITAKDPNSSCLLLPADDDRCKYVVMPMRL